MKRNTVAAESALDPDSIQVGSKTKLISNATKSERKFQLKLNQPHLQPKDWFLSENEITLCRKGSRRELMHSYSVGNNVDMFPTSNLVFESMYGDMEETTGKGDSESVNDFIYIAGWGLDNIMINPPLEESYIRDVLYRAVQRGVDIKVMIWNNVQFKKSVIEMEKYINVVLQPLAEKNHCTAMMIRDSRIEFRSTHHQKTVCIKRRGKIVSYIGGVDFMRDRWDDYEHDETSFRKKNSLDEVYCGWLDGHVRIRGPGAHDVLVNFINRWNDPEPLRLGDKIRRNSVGRVTYTFSKYVMHGIHIGLNSIKRMFGHGKLLRGPEPITIYQNGMTYPKVKGIEHFKDFVDNKVGSHAVQITRTFPARYDGYKTFAPQGETSLFEARIKAIKQATNYIFVQDQFFVYVPELMDALKAVMNEIQYLIVMVQTIEIDTKVTGYMRYQYEMTQPLLEAFPEKVRFFTVSDNVYIHSKIMIIDDVYVSIGSSNWNMRSMTADSEIAAGLVDTKTFKSPDEIDVNAFAYRFRLIKFAEAAGMIPAELEGLTFNEAVQILDDVATQESSMLQYLKIESQKHYKLYGRRTQQIIDPDFRNEDPQPIDTTGDTLCSSNAEDCECGMQSCKCCQSH